MAEPKLLIEEKEPIFHVVMNREKYGLTESDARRQDMADEYAVVAETNANAGVIIYGKYNGDWLANPWSTRFLVRELLGELNIKINNQ